MKQKYEFKNVVAETLLIPLYMRVAISCCKSFLAVHHSGSGHLS